MSRPSQDDTERDPWLSEALRHAPDAQAAPPSALSDAILRQARAAAAAPSASEPARPRSRWLAAWDWLARPPVAAGFASVMVATVVGLMWWDPPMDPTIARPPAFEATPPAPATAQQPAPASPPPPADAPQEAARSTAKPAADAASPRQRAAPRAESMPAPTPTPTPPPTPPHDEPAPFAAAAPAPASPLALRERESAAPAAPERKAGAAGDASREMATGALARSAPAKVAAAPSAQRSDEAADARPALLSALLASAAAQPERWRWERSGAMQPLTPALQRWLAQLDAATANARWRLAADSASSGETAVLRLHRDGVLDATLRLDDESVGLVAGPRAALPRATLAALKQALDDATR